jgi:hypothetical protein
LNQVEAESVDVHLLHPVTQAVDDQGAHGRVLAIHRVAAAGQILIAELVRRQPVIRRVIDALEAQHRAGFAAFGGVVEDHVQNDLDLRAMQRVHHGLELAHRVLHGVLVRGGKPGDRIVAPVIRQAASAHELLGQERLTGQQLHRGHPQGLEVGDDRLRREPEVLAPALGRHERMQLGIALDVQLVDHRVAPGCRRRAIALPVERRVDNLRAQRLLGRQSSGVRIEQCEPGIEAPAAIGSVRPVHAKRVASADARAARG